MFCFFCTFLSKSKFVKDWECSRRHGVFVFCVEEKFASEKVKTYSRVHFVNVFTLKRLRIIASEAA